MREVLYLDARLDGALDSLLPEIAQRHPLHRAGHQTAFAFGVCNVGFGVWGLGFGVWGLSVSA